MKTQFLTLGLLAASTLAAEEAGYRQNGSCCPTTCEPCCVPQPKKCIDCECYNPQFYDLQCDWGIFVDAEFLYWYARETNLEFATSTQIWGFPPTDGTATAITSEFPKKHNYVKTKWDPGVRVGIGMNTDCDGWDLYLNWTYYKTHKKGHASIPDSQYLRVTTAQIGDQDGTGGLNQPWNPGNEVGDAQDSVEHVSAQWKLNFNQIDLELGKKYYVSRCFVVRPYMGLRGAWTSTHFNVRGTVDPTTPAVPIPLMQTLTIGTFSSTDANLIHNRAWGVGLLTGFQPNFRLGNWCGCGEFSLYGNLGGSLIWGKFRSRNLIEFTGVNTIVDLAGVDTGVVTQTFSPVERDNFSRMQGIIDTALGIRWEDHWCCDRYMATIDLGWEHHYWWGFGLYHRLTASTTDESITFYQNQSNFATDLGYGGFVLRARLDF